MKKRRKLDNRPYEKDIDYFFEDIEDCAKFIFNVIGDEPDESNYENRDRWQYYINDAKYIMYYIRALKYKRR